MEFRSQRKLRRRKLKDHKFTFCDFTVFFKRLCPKLCVHHFQRILRNQRDFLRILFLWLEVQPKNDAFLHVGEIGHAETKASK